jgi:hypothetical protein
MADKLILHVGTPKTGTSNIQDYLFTHAKELAETGLLYPGHQFDSHFRAAVDLMSLKWGGIELECGGAWDALAREVNAWKGTAIISHEILARATPEQAQRARDSFPDTEIHLVLSIRDLVRQLPAEYQENIKHRRSMTYATFLERLRDPARDTNLGKWFWGVQDLPDILDRWAVDIPDEHVHLVTVPLGGHGSLTDRYARAFGLDAAAVAAHTPRSNASLGAAETALVRAINLRVVDDDRLSIPHYRELVRELLAHQTLSQREGVARIYLPEDMQHWAAELSEKWKQTLAARKYDVLGDLDDLTPKDLVLHGDGFADPDAPDAGAVAEASLDAIVALLIELGRARERWGILRQRSEGEVPSGSLVERFKRAVIRRENSNRFVRACMRMFRSTRGH